MTLVKIPIDPARRVDIENGRWDVDDAAIAEAEAQGRTISADEAAHLHQTVLDALGEIIVWCALAENDPESGYYTLERYRHGVFDVRQKFIDLIE